MQLKIIEWIVVLTEIVVILIFKFFNSLKQYS